jgi:quinolinate synthase
MAKINEQKLLNTLLSMDTDRPTGEVFVEEGQAKHAGKALQRMIDSVENAGKGK